MFLPSYYKSVSYLSLYIYLGGLLGGIFNSFDKTSEGLGEMFDGDSADTRVGQFPVMTMGGQAEVLGARTHQACKTSAGAAHSNMFLTTYFLNKYLH